MTRKPHTKFNKERQQRFLDVLRETFCVTVAAAEAGVTRTTAYTFRRNNEEFKKAWMEAEGHAIDIAEAQAYELGVKGYNREPVMYQGKQVMDSEGNPLWKRVHDTKMLELILKGNRRRKYGDKQEITGKDGKPLMGETSVVETARRVAFLLTQATKKKDGGNTPTGNVVNLR